MYQELKNYKHSPEGRAVIAQLQREYRAKKRLMKPSSIALTSPTPTITLRRGKSYLNNSHFIHISYVKYDTTKYQKTHFCFECGRYTAHTKARA